MVLCRRQVRVTFGLERHNEHGIGLPDGGRRVLMLEISHQPNI